MVSSAAVGVAQRTVAVGQPGERVEAGHETDHAFSVGEVLLPFGLPDKCFSWYFVVALGQSFIEWAQLMTTISTVCCPA